jgi:hypothetical protein
MCIGHRHSGAHTGRRVGPALSRSVFRPARPHIESHYDVLHYRATIRTQFRSGSALTQDLGWIKT